MNNKTNMINIPCHARILIIIGAIIIMVITAPRRQCKHNHHKHSKHIEYLRRHEQNVHNQVKDWQTHSSINTSIGINIGTITVTITNTITSTSISIINSSTSNRNSNNSRSSNSNSNNNRNNNNSVGIFSRNSNNSASRAASRGRGERAVSAQANGHSRPAAPGGRLWSAMVGADHRAVAPDRTSGAGAAPDWGPNGSKYGPRCSRPGCPFPHEGCAERAALLQDLAAHWADKRPRHPRRHQANACTRHLCDRNHLGHTVPSQGSWLTATRWNDTACMRPWSSVAEEGRS